MASITQTIPSYNGGISQQPDELKVPGQVKDALNVLPDLTHGLLKRPGGKLVASLGDNSTSALNSVENGKWFHYYRDENEQYIGQVNRSTGDINMWRCSDGAAMTVNYESGQETALKNYLKHTIDSDIQTLTLNDFTYITNRDENNSLTEAKMTTDVAPVKPAEAYIELKKVAYASQYSLNLYDDTSTQTVYTATRVKVERTVDSATGCRDSDGGMPAEGTLPGSTGNITRCDSTAGDDRDEYCPNVSTQIFFINIGDAWDPIHSNGQSGIFTYNRGGTNFGAGPVHETQTFDTANSTTYTLVVDPSGLNDTLTYTSDTDATLDEIVTGLKADSDYDSGSYRIEKGSFSSTTNGTIRIVFSARQSRSLSTLVGGSSTITVTQVTDHTATSTTLPKNLYMRIATTGQSVAEGNSSTPDYRCRYTTTHDLLYGGEGWRAGDTFDIWMRNAKYTVTIEDDSASNVQANAALVRPVPTPFDNKTTITAESILGDLRTGILDFTDTNQFNQSGNGATVSQIGNGLYITRTGSDGGSGAADFNVSTPVSDLLNVFTNKVDDVEDLPNQCKHGYVVKVANSAADEDDYWLKFFGNNDRDGEGVWEECPEPGIKIKFNPATMPIQMIREANGTFTVKQLTWEDRLVGDSVTTPEPSFIGQRITKLLFFRNRLVMLSDENVNMSRPGDFFNFWPKTAITYSAVDNIDLSCSSEYPAIVYDGIQVNQGLTLFTKNQQFMLTTDSDTLNPQTAKINAVSTYNFNFNTNPISLGTTIGFLDNGGKNTRFFEMSGIAREGAPEVIEQSKVVSKLFPKDLTLVANSRENSVIFFAAKGSDEVFGYRYFSSIEKRVQNAWFRWKLSGVVQHMCMLDDSLYVIVRNNNKDVMQQFTIKLDDATNTLVNDLGTDTTDDDLTYRLHLDNATSVAHTQLTYDSTNDWTTFPIPDGFNNTLGTLHAIVVPTTSDKTFQGMSGPAYTFKVGSTDSVKLPGNWKTYDPQMVKDSVTSDDVTPPGTIILGYLFDMEVKFPTIYYTRPQGEGIRSEVQGSLMLHRLKFSFGPIGVYETTLDRVGKRPYTELYEAVIADEYISNRVQFTPDSYATIPVYERNTNLTLSLKSTHPSPATLFSMTWEGDYSNKYYKRV